MHILAYVYHWERASLWLLSKSERKMWADLIHEQKEAENRVNNPDEYEDDFEEDET